MNKVKELLIKVLDEGETTSVKDMKWPSLRIGKWLLISMAFLSPLLGCILGGTFMNVDSREFNVLVIPLLLNCVICLCSKRAFPTQIKVTTHHLQNQVQSP